MGKKRIEIIIETERIILIKRRSHPNTERCDWCGAAAATFEVDNSGQARKRRDEPFQGSARSESEACPGCGKKWFYG